MKKTQRKDALRNIKKRIVSFLSICIVIALGFGVLFTTRYTSAGLDKEYGNFFKSHNFKDYEMLCLPIRLDCGEKKYAVETRSLFRGEITTMWRVVYEQEVK